MLRTLWDMFLPGDVVLADRLMCSWTEMVMLQGRGVDLVTSWSRRKADFRRGKRLGKGDHIAPSVEALFANLRRSPPPPKLAQSRIAVANSACPTQAEAACQNGVTASCLLAIGAGRTDSGFGCQSDGAKEAFEWALTLRHCGGLAGDDSDTCDPACIF